jgi:RNA polymerase sigma-70 factor, ECF subfamily
MSDAATERALVQAARAGDAAAWRVLFDSCAESVRRYAVWRAGGDVHLAEDAVQDAWLTAAKTLPRFDPGRGTFAAWLGGLTANAVRARLRTARRGSLHPLEHEPAGREWNWRVAEVLAALPGQYEAVLKQKYVDGLSVVEIAALAGQTEKAVESQLSRARQAFREAYAS